MPASSKPNFLWSILTMKCPRCRRGRMFNTSNPWKLKKVFDMPTQCEECGQRYELEVGFWYGTAYVSYALSVAMSLTYFVAWYVIIGMSTTDNRFFWWLGTNVGLLVFLQPWIMRLSRVIYLYFFVRYDADYKNTQTKKFDYETGSYYENNEAQP
jgi:uncharacterized protein (DUF983 family)